LNTLQSLRRISIFLSRSFLFVLRDFNFVLYLIITFYWQIEAPPFLLNQPPSVWINKALLMGFIKMNWLTVMAFFNPTNPINPYKKVQFSAPLV